LRPSLVPAERLAAAKPAGRAPHLLSKKRIAIIHYWLVGMRGGEKVVEALCRLLPDADIFTLFYEPEEVSSVIRARNVHASFLNPLRKHYRSLLPLMPLALEAFDLRDYDLVISSESGPAKGVIVPSSARHICYCHTPMRYLWDLYPAYLREFTSSGLKRALMAPLAAYLRLWDFASSARVDSFIANSHNVQQRIWRTYRRESRVIYPPVAIDRFFWKPDRDYLLIVSELVAYKRLDYAVRYCAQQGIRLKIAGDGPEFSRLKNLAGKSVEFCGRVTDGELCQLYSHSMALLMPGEEDFGMTMVEALASGKPVIALGRGGALEIVEPGCGFLFEEPTPDALHTALRRLYRAEFCPSDLQAGVQKFSEMEFHRHMQTLIESHAGV
jgi:glycosyltransferase involved in cell wall biosynthesis